MIQYAYLFLFLVGLSCAKLIAVETIFVIQLTFYCLIPTGPINPTFQALTNMRYVSGINPFFSNLPQAEISSNLALLGIESNFLSNVNLTLVFFLLCPVFNQAFRLLAKSFAKTSWVWEARFSRYSKACIR